MVTDRRSPGGRRRTEAEVRDKLCAAAGKVRTCLETRAVLETFPAQCCGSASRLLGKYLVEVERLSPVAWVTGGQRRRPDGDPDLPQRQSHSWLEHAGFIIDITADQFADGPGPVVVTTDRGWHEQFRGQRRVGREEMLRFNDFLADLYAKLLERVTGAGKRRLR